MRALHRSPGGVAAQWIAAVGIAALLAAPLAPVTEPPPPPPVVRDVQLTAVTVPPGGLITSFLGNQVIYCSIICPLVVQTAATAALTTLLSPVTFLQAGRSGDLFRALGAAAASVTGPTNTAAQATILADGTRVAPRALNAFEVGVVGLLNVLPAAADGLPGIVRAVQRAREDTYTALNLPIVPNPEPTVRPRSVLQVAVVEAINVGASIVFPAFNHVPSAVFETPDAVAQELAATGDPVRALVAGVGAVTRRLVAAGTVVAEAVVTAVRNIGTAIDESRAADRATPTDGEEISAESAVGSPKFEETPPPMQSETEPDDDEDVSRSTRTSRDDTTEPDDDGLTRHRKDRGDDESAPTADNSGAEKSPSSTAGAEHDDSGDGV